MSASTGKSALTVEEDKEALQASGEVFRFGESVGKVRGPVFKASGLAMCRFTSHLEAIQIEAMNRLSYVVGENQCRDIQWKLLTDLSSVSFTRTELTVSTGKAGGNCGVYFSRVHVASHQSMLRD